MIYYLLGIVPNFKIATPAYCFLAHVAMRFFFFLLTMSSSISCNLHTTERFMFLINQIVGPKFIIFEHTGCTDFFGCKQISSLLFLPKPFLGRNFLSAACIAEEAKAIAGSTQLCPCN